MAADDKKYSVEGDLAYDEGWSYAEDNLQEQHLNAGPYSKETERELFEAWADGFWACWRHINK